MGIPGVGDSAELGMASRFRYNSRGLIDLNMIVLTHSFNRGLVRASNTVLDTLCLDPWALVLPYPANSPI